MKYTIKEFAEDRSDAEQINNTIDSFLHISVKAFYELLLAACAQDEKEVRKHQTTYRILKDKAPRLEEMTMGELLKYAGMNCFYIEDEDAADTFKEAEPRIAAGVMIIRFVLMDWLCFYGQKQSVQQTAFSKEREGGS